MRVLSLNHSFTLTNLIQRLRDKTLTIEFYLFCIVCGLCSLLWAMGLLIFVLCFGSFHFGLNTGPNPFGSLCNTMFLEHKEHCFVLLSKKLCMAFYNDNWIVLLLSVLLCLCLCLCVVCCVVLGCVKGSKDKVREYLRHRWAYKKEKGGALGWDV